MLRVIGGAGHGVIGRAAPPLSLSFWSCVPFREIRLRDLDGVGDFLGMPDPAFGRGSSGGSLAPRTVAGQGKERAVQARQRVIGAVPAITAATVSRELGADVAQA